MKYHQIQKRAKDMGINSYGIKKTDLIRVIQSKENNIDCYGTERAGSCNEHECLWRSDCLTLNHTKDKKK